MRAALQIFYSAWDGVAEVRPFGAMEENIMDGVYCVSVGHH